MYLKLVRENGVISTSSYLNVLKIRIKTRKNDLNRQIYPYGIKEFNNPDPSHTKHKARAEEEEMAEDK